MRWRRRWQPLSSKVVSATFPFSLQTQEPQAKGRYITSVSDPIPNKQISQWLKVRPSFTSAGCGHEEWWHRGLGTWAARWSSHALLQASGLRSTCSLDLLACRQPQRGCYPSVPICIQNLFSGVGATTQERFPMFAIPDDQQDNAKGRPKVPHLPTTSWHVFLQPKLAYTFFCTEDLFNGLTTDKEKP